MSISTLNSKDRREVTEEDLDSMTAKCAEVSDWPDHGRDLELERILNGLNKLMELNVAEPFITPISLENYPDYLKFIGYPVDLQTIRDRIVSGYYRRVDAILWDIHKIEWNAQLYRKYIDDKASDRIVFKATLLVDVLNAFVSDPTMSDPMTVYMKQASGVCVESVVNSQVSSPSQASSTRSTNRRKAKRKCENVEARAEVIEPEIIIPEQNQAEEVRLFSFLLFEFYIFVNSD
jgi:hypothetical protein